MGLSRKISFSRSLWPFASRPLRRCVFVFSPSQVKLTKKQKMTSAESQLKSMCFADPAPTPENVEASAENVAELRSRAQENSRRLGTWCRITTSVDGIGVMAGIQQFISNHRRKAATHTNKDGEPVEIIVPDDFAFGFEQYLDEATMLDDDELIPVLDKQRQILSYLLNKLCTKPNQRVLSQSNVRS